MRSVAKTYRHVCEIPHAAYRAVGVNMARGGVSVVTVEDVEAASNDWDARSILYGIDMQWG